MIFGLQGRNSDMRTMAWFAAWAIVLTGVLLAAPELAVAQVGGEDCQDCFGSAFTSIGASWATIGYAYQADFLWQVDNTKLGQWVTLLYVLSVAGGIVGAAMGMPPKQYLWFIIGPGVFHWMVGATQPAGGVEWSVGGDPQGQRIVWRDSEVGLQDSNLFTRVSSWRASRNSRPTGGDDNGQFRVSTLFLHVDALLSSTSEWLVGWTGAGFFNGKGGANSNLAEPRSAEGPWHIFSSLRWPLLENMTGGQVRNPDLRDALVTFLSSECGGKFKQAIDSAGYTAAAQGKGDVVPISVFQQDGQGTTGNDPDQVRQLNTYRRVTQQLDTTSVPTPPALVRLFEDRQGETSFGRYIQEIGNGRPRDLGRYEYIVCSDFLWSVVHGLRWEAGQTYWQMMRSAPAGVEGDDLIVALFHGWSIRDQRDGELADPIQMHHFARNLTFAHLLRNELQLAPSIVDMKYAPAQQSRQLSETYARTLGTKAKYGELANWAFMMPHIQGLLLFIIIAAYPLCAMVVVVPGWHKMFFTWLAFFAWVKTWDVGFALIQVIERSLWAMMGNNSNFDTIARRVLRLGEEYGTIGVSCPRGGGVTQLITAGQDRRQVCPVAQVCANGTGNNQGNLDCAAAGSSMANAAMDNTYGMLDQALVIASSANLDLAGSYYLYIMAALYFAVPAITGQIVLGAKAGATSLVTGAVSGVAERAGAAAQTGAQGALATIAQTNQASVSQAAYQSSMMKSGLGAMAIDAANRKMDADRENVFLSEASRGMKRMGDATGLAQSSASNTERFFDAVRPGSSRRDEEIKDPKKAGDAGGGKDAADGAKKYRTSWGTTAYDVAFNSANQLTGGTIGSFFDSAQRNMRHTAFNKGFDSNAQNFRASVAEGNMGMDGAGLRLQSEGLSTASQRLRSMANFNAESAAWAARNSFAMDAAAQASVLGLNAGSLNPGNKPSDLDGFAMTGGLGSSARAAAHYAGGNFIQGGLSGMSNLKSGNGSATGFWGYGGDGVRRAFQGDQYGTNPTFAGYGTTFGSLGAYGTQFWTGWMGDFTTKLPTYVQDSVNGFKDGTNPMNKYFNETVDKLKGGFVMPAESDTSGSPKK